MRKNDTSAVTPVDILVALVLLTRLPLPKLPATAFEQQARSVWAFPVAGLCVGVSAAAVGWVLISVGLPLAIAAGAILACQIVLTGAMHEDGLADCADGFWGGYDPARRLEIMKDSQIGTYGVLALLFSVGFRWGALMVVLPVMGPGSIIAIAMLSRAPMGMVMAIVPNARGTGLSSQVGKPTRAHAGLGISLALLLSWPMLGFPALILCAVVVSIFATLCATLAQTKIKGQTGDVLGATQQVCEGAMLLCLAALTTSMGAS